MRILLLNPPGKQLYTRDYYCSKTSKANYCYHPVDLLILSGILATEHEIKVIDCMAEELNGSQTLSQIEAFGPQVVIFLTGSVSWEEDEPFMREVKQLTQAIIIASGDVLLEDGAKRLQDYPVLDAIILDFTSTQILSWLRGERTANYDSLIYLEATGQVRHSGQRERGGEFSIEVPRHDLFPFKKYRYPFVKGTPFATILTDYGCPYKCSFCVMPHLGYKTRPVANVLEELRAVRQLGIKEIYFNDQTFVVNQKRGQALFKAMIEEGFNFGWVSFSRVDLVDEEYLRLMRQAGCHTLIFGVESGNDATLERYHKGFTTAQVERTFALCRSLNIDVVATYVFGLPGETAADIKRTIAFALKLKCDYASFNVVVPRMGTQLRQEAVESGLVDPNELHMDQTGSFAVMGTDTISAAELLALKDLAVKSFYLRPRYLLRRLLMISSWFDLKNQLSEGWALINKIGEG